jgi:acetyl-CoA acetyltransferase
MDKTLMRPLFRKRATQLRKVDGKAVPKFFVGGIMSAGNMLRAGAAPAFRYIGTKNVWTKSFNCISRSGSSWCRLWS